MKSILTFLISATFVCLVGSLLQSCDKWEFPTRKTQRNCIKPGGTLTAQTQQRKVDFSITNSSGTIDRVIWDFGNGSTTATTGMTVSYTYPTSNTYTAKATLSNSCGNETTLNLAVTVADATAPTVSLQPATALSINAATLGMTVTSTGNATITRYGVCYSSTNTMPEIDKGDVLISYKSESVAINSPISFSLINLQPNTLYYVRSFATNSSGKTGYNPDPVQTFRTGSKPSVNSAAATNVSVRSASANFIVTNPGSPAAIEYGICYSLKSMPDVTDTTNTTVITVATPAVGSSVAVPLSNLTPNTKYYYRAYAKLASGEFIYSPTENFTTQVDTLVQDLIASVSFTDGSLTDVSGNNNNAILVDNPTFTADRKGKANSAIQLDGLNDYFYMKENSTLNQTNALSISVWIRPTVVNGRMLIYNKSRFSDGAFEMYSSLIKLENDLGPGITINTDIKQGSGCQAGKGWQTFPLTSKIQLNTWHHVVMTYSGRSARMYFDSGLLFTDDALPANTIDLCPGGDLKFGAQSQVLPQYFNGAMDDIRIYKRALSANEVKALFDQ